MTQIKDTSYADFCGIGHGTYKKRIVPTMIAPVKEVPHTIRQKTQHGLAFVQTCHTYQHAVKAVKSLEMAGRTYLIFSQDRLICSITNGNFYVVPTED